MKSRWQKAQVSEESYRARRVKVRNYEKTQTCKRTMGTDFHEGFDFFEGKKILEVGCGAFGMIHYLDVVSFKVGLDPLCSNYRNIIRQTPSTAHLISGVSEKLPFKDNMFDVLLCLNVLDHVIDPQVSVEEMARVLRAGGTLFLNVNVFNLVPKIFRRALGVFDRPHPHHFNSAEVTSLLKQVGFNIDSGSKVELNRFPRPNKFDAHAIKVAIAMALGIRQFCERCTLSVDKMDKLMDGQQ